MVGPHLSGTSQRFVGVLFLIPFVMVVWIDVKIASIMVTILAAGMAHEYTKMLKLPSVVPIMLALLITLQSLPPWLFDAGVAWHSGLAAMSFGISMIYRGILAALFALALSICLYFSSLILSQADGHRLLLVLAVAVAACDTAAYFVGRFVGGAKLAPQVSPNKTVSGSVGGVFAAIIVMVCLARIPALAPSTALGYINNLDVNEVLFLGCGVAILSQIGDLLESALKRHFNIKDSGAILPGHGGLLDRFDGYLFTVPGFYLFFFTI